MKRKLWQYLCQPASVILILAVFGLLYYVINYMVPWWLFTLLTLICLAVVVVVYLRFPWWTGGKSSLKTEKDADGDPLAILLTGRGRASLSVRPEQILFIEAEGHYVNVYYIEGEEVKNKVLRLPIGEMETALQSQPSLVRCHRTFIVNARQVAAVKGNSQSRRLCLHHIDQEIPVSLSYAKDFNVRSGFAPKLF